MTSLPITDDQACGRRAPLRRPTRELLYTVSGTILLLTPEEADAAFMSSDVRSLLEDRLIPRYQLSTGEYLLSVTDLERFLAVQLRPDGGSYGIATR